MYWLLAPLRYSPPIFRLRPTRYMHCIPHSTNVALSAQMRIPIIRTLKLVPRMLRSVNRTPFYVTAPFSSYFRWPWVELASFIVGLDCSSLVRSLFFYSSGACTNPGLRFSFRMCFLRYLISSRSESMSLSFSMSSTRASNVLLSSSSFSELSFYSFFSYYFWSFSFTDISLRIYS